MEKTLVLHSLIPEATSHSRTVEDLARKLLEGKVNLASEAVMVFVSEGIVKEAGGHPSGRLGRELPPRLGPIGQQARHTSHVFPSGLFRLCPTRKDTLGGIRHEGVRKIT